MNEEYKKKIECCLASMKKRTYIPIGETGFAGFVTKERLSLQEAVAHERSPYEKGTKWGNKWEYGWFFTEVTIPEDCKGKRMMFSAELGECLIFVNGKVYGSLDREHPMITLAETANGGEHYDIAMEVYAGHSGLDGIPETANVLPCFRIMIPEEQIQEFPENVTQKTVSAGEFGIFHEELFQLWMDVNTLYDLRNSLDGNCLRAVCIDKGLKAICNLIDIEAPMAELLEMAARARKITASLLESHNSSSAPTMYVVGHSHLDLEWLWTKEETRRKAARTLGNQLKLIEEYEDYIYIQSQPWILETVKNEYPDLYKEVKEAVKKGRIVVEGGMWVESDTNLPSGESLIRQFVFGKRFISEEFGKESEIYWLPDSFGCSAALPQIMKGCNIRYFMNAKIQWLYNGGDRFPHTTFMWKGIDGTEILSHLMVGYAMELTPSAIIRKWNENAQKEEVPAKLIPYGHGDGGGGATRIHLEYLKREKDLEGMPKVVAASPNEFFHYAEEECGVKTRYVGELYYSAHRGSYTSQANTKKLNRRSELMLREAEMWTALIGKDNCIEEEQCIQKETNLLWKDVLFNQFHDILPGTALKEVYERTEENYRHVVSRAEEIAEHALETILERTPEYLTVFNSLSWDRKVLAELPDKWNAVCDNDGNYIRTQIVGNKVMALLNVPSCGYSTYRLCSTADAEGADYSIDENAAICTAQSISSGKEIYLENNLIIAVFNRQGELVSILDKETGMEFLTEASNRFRMYQDVPTMYDAWDIDSFYEQTEVEITKDAEIEAECKGDLLASLMIRRKINHSDMTQRVILRKDSRRIDFETEVDWNETHRLLKVDFNTNIHTEELISEIQFGYIKRPNHKSRQYDADRFEVCQQKWSALTEGNRGVAILNDCKYGISADGGSVSLTLLKSAMAPALNADKGVHRFTYSVMPFMNNFFDSRVVEEAYELNCPAFVKEGNAGEKSLLRVSDKNIIVDTVKFAEDGSGNIIIRLYESKDSYTNCRLEFGFAVKEVYAANMLEENQQRLLVQNDSVAISCKAFEVVTLRVIV